MNNSTGALRPRTSWCCPCDNLLALSSLLIALLVWFLSLLVTFTSLHLLKFKLPFFFSFSPSSSEEAIWRNVWTSCLLVMCLLATGINYEVAALFTCWILCSPAQFSVHLLNSLFTCSILCWRAPNFKKAHADHLLTCFLSLYSSFPSQFECNLSPRLSPSPLHNLIKVPNYRSLTTKFLVKSQGNFVSLWCVHYLLGSSTKMLRWSPGEQLNQSAPAGDQLKLPLYRPGSPLFTRFLPRCHFECYFSLCMSPPPLCTILKVVLFLFFWSCFEEVISWNFRTIQSAGDALRSYIDRLWRYCVVHLVN